MKHWLVVVMGLACACGAARAAGDQQAAFGALKYRMLLARADFDAVLHPPGDQPDGDPRIYFGAASTLALSRVAVSVDGGASAEQALDAREAQALAGSGELIWLEAAALPDGPHRVHAVVQATDTAKPEAGVQTFETDAQVDFEQAGAALEFSLAGSSLLHPARLEVHEHRGLPPPRGWLQRSLSTVAGIAQPDGNFITGSSADPRVRYAAWLSSLERYDAAAVELLAVRQQAHGAALPNTYWLRLAAALRQAHLPDQAAAICDLLDAAKAEREAVGVERLRLGLMQYRTGNTAEAEQQLLSAHGRLPADRVQDWQVAYAQIQFDRDQYAAALRTLGNGNVETIDAYRYMDQSTEAVRTSAYRRYNLAVAMVHEGDEAHGLSLLDLVGRLKSSDGDDDLMTLRDKANLTLGWHFLRQKQGATAMGILGRVRSEGRLSNRALLGMGWAQLVPGGKKFERSRLKNDIEDPLNPLPAGVRNSLIQLGVLEPETRGEVGPRNFTRDRPAKTREEAFHRAMSFWSYLADQDAREPAVQEGLLAIAWGYDSLGDTAHAREAYGRAIAALEARKQALGEDENVLGGLPGGLDAAADEASLVRLMDRFDLPPADSATALYASVDRYQDLGRLSRSLAELQPALAGRSGAPDTAPMLAELGTARVAEAQTLQALAHSQLEQQKAGIDGYLKLAYFAAARTEDANLDQGTRN